MKKTIILTLLSIFTLGITAQTSVTPVADAGGSGRYFAKLHPTKDVGVSKDDGKVFSFYLNSGVATFQSLRVRDQMYVVKAGECVVICTLDPKEIQLVTITDEYPEYPSSIGRGCDAMFTLDADIALADFREEKDLAIKEHVYRLTNNAASGGFGFTHFTGTTMKAGQFFIISTRRPTSNGRLDVVWLDEDGNEINDMQSTGIRDLEATAPADDAVYTLQGVRVTKTTKGQLYIRNGRKFLSK